MDHGFTSHLEPADFTALHLSAAARLIFRVIASFAEYSVSRSCSTVLYSMAAAAAFISAIANYIRL